MLVGVCLFIAFIIAVIPYETVKTHKELVAFNDGVGINGGLFVVHHESYYVMYIHTADNGIEQMRVFADRAVIYEGERKNGFIEIYTKVSAFGNPIVAGKTYKIYVPKGTVVHRFTADLE